MSQNNCPSIHYAFKDDRRAYQENNKANTVYHIQRF